jgi:hypothetical protein
MKSIVARAVALAAFGAVAAGLTAGTANARPLEEIRCTPIDQVIASAEHVITTILQGKNEKEEKRCEIEIN